MTQVKKGAVRPSILDRVEFTFPFSGMGAVATDGVQYTTVATVGTTAVTLVDELLDPGHSASTLKVAVGLTQSFTGLNGSLVGSLAYYWRARSEYVNTEGTLITGGWVAFTGTYVKQVGTLATTEDTFSGLIDRASLPAFPARFQLIAVDKASAARETGKLKSSSFVRFEGLVIPGC